MIPWTQRNTPFQCVSLLLLFTLPILALPSFASESKPVATTKEESPVLVKTMAELAKAVSKAKPCDVITLADGNYDQGCTL